MTSPFAQPSAGGDKFEPRDHNGRLLLIYAKSYNAAESTKHGETTSADADVIVVDAVGPDGGPVVLHNARVFGNLARSVRDDVGGVVLGRLGQGPNTKGNPPWILLNHTDADIALAGPIHQRYQAGQFKPVEQPPQAPAAAPPQQWGAPPQAPAPDMWAGTNAQPPAQQQWGAPPPQAPQYPPPVPGSVEAFLISKGVPQDKLATMDDQTKQMLASTFR